MKDEDIVRLFKQGLTIKNFTGMIEGSRKLTEVEAKKNSGKSHIRRLHAGFEICAKT